MAVSNSAGAAATINSYDEYGVPGTSNAGRFQYTGQIWLPELGLYHYKARAYSPVLGRFMQTDPVGYQDQINLYAYVGNDPTNRTDPSGNIGELEAAGCAITIEVGCLPGAAVGAIADIAVTGGGIVLCTAYCGELFDHVFKNEQGQQPEQAEEPRPGTKESDKGCIYCVSGDKTKSGKDYVGSADDLEARARKAQDDRDRKDAEIIGEYKKGELLPVLKTPS